MNYLLSSSMQQALFESGMPPLNRKSSRTFLAFKRCKRQKIREVIILLEQISLKNLAHVCTNRGYNPHIPPHTVAHRS